MNKFKEVVNQRGSFLLLILIVSIVGAFVLKVTDVKEPLAFLFVFLPPIITGIIIAVARCK